MANSTGRIQTCPTCNRRLNYCRHCKEFELRIEVKKKEVEELKRKVKFLRYCSPFDHDPSNPEDDWTSSYATDVFLVASDDHDLMNSSVPAHKAILTNKSPVFRPMFRNELVESQTNTIKISEVSHHDLCALVKYLYTAEVNLADDQMTKNLLILGEKYRVEHLKAFCENFLISKLNAENALNFFTFAIKYDFTKDLMEASLSVIKLNMERIIMQKQYKELIQNDPLLVIHIHEAYHKNE